jgi:hypothetical protein
MSGAMGMPPMGQPGMPPNSSGMPVHNQGATAAYGMMQQPQYAMAAAGGMRPTASSPTAAVPPSASAYAAYGYPGAQQS